MNLAHVLAHLDQPRRCGKSYSAFCRAHEDRKRSLSFTPSDERGLLFCFAGCSFPNILAAHGLKPADLLGARTDVSGLSREERVRYARRLWESSRKVSGTVAEKYLREARGITVPLPHCLRFLPRLVHREFGWPFPALVAGIQDVAGEFTGVQVCYLSADGSDKAPVKVPRKTFGPARGGAVRLAPAANVLALAEGIETALSILQATGIPTWATLGTSNLARVEFPDSVRTVIVAADHDPAGIKAAREAVQTFLRRGLNVRVALPPDDAADFNEVRL